MIIGAVLWMALLTITTISQAQILHPVKWSYAAKKGKDGTAVLMLKATIDPGWHIYSLHVKEGGPVKTSFVFEKNPGYQLLGTISEPKPISRFEETFGMDVAFFEKEVIFSQKVKLLKKTPVTAKGTLTFMVCNDKQCLPPEDVPFSIVVK